MRSALAAVAVLTWIMGAAAMAFAAWLRLRTGRRGLIVAAYAGGLIAQVAWLRGVAAKGIAAVWDPAGDVGMTGWAAWAVGTGGVAALLSSLRGSKGRESLLSDPDRTGELALGLFGAGVLLRQLALVA